MTTMTAMMTSRERSRSEDSWPPTKLVWRMGLVLFGRVVYSFVAFSRSMCSLLPPRDCWIVAHLSLVVALVISKGENNFVVSVTSEIKVEKCELFCVRFLTKFNPVGPSDDPSYFLSFKKTTNFSKLLKILNYQRILKSQLYDNRLEGHKSSR